MEAQVAGGGSRIGGIDQFNVGILFEEGPALQNGHRMGVDLSEIFEPLSGQGQQVLRNTQVDLSNNGQRCLLQQGVVGQDAAGHRVLYRSDSVVGLLLGETPKQLVKGAAGQNSYLVVIEIELGCNLVESAVSSQNSHLRNGLSDALIGQFGICIHFLYSISCCVKTVFLCALYPGREQKKGPENFSGPFHCYLYGYTEATPEFFSERNKNKNRTSSGNH